MATYPFEPTVLSDAEKSAFRSLLYDAMMDIRGLCQSRLPASRNPLTIWRQYNQSRLAGALADWLHNLAQHAATEFNEFNTEWFWEEYGSLSRRFPDLQPGKWMDYRERYEKHLARIRKG